MCFDKSSLCCCTHVMPCECSCQRCSFIADARGLALQAVSRKPCGLHTSGHTCAALVVRLTQLLDGGWLHVRQPYQAAAAGDPAAGRVRQHLCITDG